MRATDPHSRIYVITGKIHGGKTTLVTRLAEQFKKESITVSGFIAPGSFQQGVRSDFTLINVKNGEQIPLATLGARKGWMNFRRFSFNPVAFQLGEAWIREGVSSQDQLVIIDEVGPMELKGLGWDSTLKYLEMQSDIVQLWIVREQMLQEVLGHWNIPHSQVFRMNEEEEDLFDTVYSELKGKL